MKGWLRKLIACSEIVQPLLPLLFAADAMQAFAALRQVDGATPLAYRLFQFGFYVAVCALTFVAGVQLWRARPSGYKLSLLAQALQIPVINTGVFSYAVKFTCGIWIFCNFDTGYVGFSASLIDNTEFALVFGAQHVAPRQEINLLAVAILIWLIRAMRRQRPGFVEAPKAPLPHRLWRFAWRSIAALLLLALVPLSALWVYNRFDEKPTAAAEHWFAPLPHRVADADNAWLYMLGLGAAREQDPIALARLRLDAYERRAAQPGPLPLPDAAEDALNSDAVPFRQTDARGEKVEFCEPTERDCIAWSAANAARLTDLEHANALLLQRYDTLLGLSGFEDLASPSKDEPVPDTSKEASLYRALIWRDLADQATRAGALQRLARMVEFAQRTESSASSVHAKALALRLRERCMRILDTLLDRAGERGLDPLHDTIDVVLRVPTPAQLAWEPVLHREALRFRTAMAESVFPGPIDAWRYCTKRCLVNWLFAQLYAPQATRNLYAQLWDARLALHNGDAREMSAGDARIKQLLDAALPLADSSRETARRMVYNFTGRTMAAMSAPRYADYLTAQHDTEALRRMLSLKIAVLREHVSPAKMPEWLAQQRAALGDPYSGEAFAWDDAAHALRFTPQSKLWSAKQFSVAYVPAAAAPPRR